MESLTELYDQALVPMDNELEKQAEEMWKQAEEEDAAGRIMARGFADELNKLSMPMGTGYGHGKGMKYGPGDGMVPPAPAPQTAKPLPTPGGSIKSAPYQTGGGATAPKAVAKRPTFKPPAPKTQAKTGTFQAGSKISPAGNVT